MTSTMVPINEVLIAKIVLGYLSSRNLSGTADYFVKECEGFRSSNESGLCEKERILNHLEGMNLLPSLEDILKDYFAYQGPDEATNDKVYMLWKQVDIVIGQLRAITMGKSKARAFMHSRRTPRTFNKLVSRNENVNESDANHVAGNATNSFVKDGMGSQNTPSCNIFENQNQKENCSPLQEDRSGKRSETLILTTPVKESIRKDDKKEFRSPRRKPRHPRHVTTPTEELIVTTSTEELINKCPSSDIGSDAHLNKEFSDLVATLISNDKLSAKLADNINKVVSVETKPPINKYDNIDEIIKLTADDPDLNVLFSMLGTPHLHSTQDNITQSGDHHFDINTGIASNGLNAEASTLNNFIELQPIVTSASNGEIQVVDSNLQPSFCMPPGVKVNSSQTGDSTLEPFIMQDSTMTNFLEILDPYNTGYPCMRDLNADFCDYASKTETSYEPLSLPEPLPNITEKTTLPSSHVDVNRPVSNGSTIISPQLQSSSLCTEVPYANELDNNMKKNVDDNVILASRALLQLSTSPMKLSTTSTIENVISQPVVSPQALASNRKTSRELICSTSSCSVQENALDMHKLANDLLPLTNQIVNSQNILVSDPYQIRDTSASNLLDVVVKSKEERKHGRKKHVKIKKDGITGEELVVSPCENEEANVNRKAKRAKEIMVTQLDFNPAIPSAPLNRLNQPCSKGNANSAIGDDSVGVAAKIAVTDQCDSLSPASLLHAQLKTLNSKNLTIVHNPEFSYMTDERAVSDVKTKLGIDNENTCSVGLLEETYSKCSVVKPTSDQFQTFRITGNAISKVVNLDNKDACKAPDLAFNCESKIQAISMVINNTSSLNKISDANSLTAMNNTSIGTVISPNGYDPLCSSVGSTTVRGIEKNFSMPSILPKEKQNNDYAPGDSTSTKEDEVSPISNVDTNIPVKIKCDSSKAKSESKKVVGNHSSLEKRGKETRALPYHGRKIAKKKEKSDSKMTVKFNFAKSPSRKKKFVPEVENKTSVSSTSLKDSEVEVIHCCDTSSDAYDIMSQKVGELLQGDNVHHSMSKIEPLYPVATTVCNQETSTQSIFDCLKAACNVYVTTSTTHVNDNIMASYPSNNIMASHPPDKTAIDFSVTTSEKRVSSSTDITTRIPNPNNLKTDTPMNNVAHGIARSGLSTTNVLTSEVPRRRLPIRDSMGDIITDFIPTTDIHTNDVPVITDSINNKINKINNILSSVVPTIETPASVLLPNDIQINTEEPSGSSHLSQRTSEYMDIFNSNVQTKSVKKKAKRKRKLSLLLNVDNVAQLLSGIDYS